MIKTRIIFLIALIFLIGTGAMIAQDKFYPSISLGLVNSNRKEFTNVSLEGDYNYLFWRKMSIGAIAGVDFIGGHVNATLIKLGGTLRFFFGQDYRSDTSLYMAFGKLISTNQSKVTNNPANPNNGSLPSIFVRPFGFRFRVGQFNVGDHEVSLMAETYMEVTIINLSLDLISSSSDLKFTSSDLKFTDFGLGIAFRF